MELFENIKRSRAEMRVVNGFIPKLESAIKSYSSKEYERSIKVLLECKSMLIPIYDILPKCKVSYYLMKSYYKNRQYQTCKEEINELNEIIERIDNTLLLYLKAKIKIYQYQTISNITLNNNKESISNIINTIEFIKQQKFNASKRAQLFWIFIKGFLGEAGLNKTKQWDQFHEYYDAMKEEAEEERISKIIKDIYKSLMSTKTRKVLFDHFNNAFFLHKYGLGPENRVIAFLEKNLGPCVRENNLVKLRLKVEGYLNLGKLSLKEYFPNISLADLLTEQKLRLLSFDTLFGNLCGCFSAIFKEYFIDNTGNANQYDKFRLLIASNGEDDENNIHKDSEMNFDDMDEDNINEILQTESLIQKTSNKSINIKNAKTIEMKRPTLQTKLSRNEFGIRGSRTVCNPEFNFSKDVTIPPNPQIEENVNSNTQREGMIKTVKTTYPNANANAMRRTSTKQMASKLPLNKTDLSPRLSNTSHQLQDVNNKRDSIGSNQELDTRDKKLVLAQIQQQISTQHSAITFKPKEPPIVLRNINNFLFATLSSHFITAPLLKKSDLNSIRIQNYVKSYFSATEKNSHPTQFTSDNQDVSFMYENFLLIKNFYLFGVCDGHGKNGKLIADAVSILFPSNLLYLIIDNNLIKRNENLNEIVISLFKMEEKSEVKDINLLKYFFMKLDIDFDRISFVKQALHLIRNEIVEAIARTNEDCKTRKKIDAELSGCTLCSIFIYGKVLYAANVGDSRAVLGTHIYDENRWITKELTFDHKPDNIMEAKRIALSGGRIAQTKNEHGIEGGPFRVWLKNSDSTTPGLAISRTIGDYQAKTIGVTYEPSIYEYQLDKNDKIIIIATDGLWENMKNEQAIAICGEFYENKKRAEDASYQLIQKAKEDKIKRNKPYDDITCIVIFLDVKD